MKEKIKKKEVVKKMKKIAGADSFNCVDIQCPFHGKLSTRGRKFEGYVIKKFPRRIVIEFEKTIYVKKYERYVKKKTKLHARLPECMKDKVMIGDYVEIKECRPLSKIIHFVLIKILRKKENNQVIEGGEK